MHKKSLLVYLLIISLVFNLFTFISTAQNADFVYVENTVAVKSDGTVWYWGEKNSSKLIATQVIGLSDIVKVASNENHAIALKKDGTLWAWGYNAFGKLGTGSKVSTNKPVKLTGIDNVKDIIVSNDYSAALKNDGTVWTWGRNRWGQLGLGKYNEDQLTPSKVPGLEDIKGFACAQDHMVAVTTDGHIYAWGENSFGQFGNGKKGDPYSHYTYDEGVDSLLPLLIEDMNGVVEVACSESSTIVLRKDGTVWECGRFGMGKLYEDIINFKKVEGIDNVISIKSSSYCRLLKKSDQTLWGWGYNALGQFQTKSIGMINKPIRTEALESYKYVFLDISHSVGIKNDGSLWAWGGNSSGELGDGSTIDRITPSKVIFSKPTKPTDITVLVNHQVINFDVKPTIVKGRTLVPMRQIFEALGAEVSWDDKTRKVSAYKDNESIQIIVDNNLAYVNNKKIVLDVPPIIIDGRTFVPTRFISESLGATVKWDDKFRSVIISNLPG